MSKTWATFTGDLLPELGGTRRRAGLEAAFREVVALSAGDRNGLVELTLLLDMWVIFMDISTGRGGSSFVKIGRASCRERV